MLQRSTDIRNGKPRSRVVACYVVLLLSFGLWAIYSKWQLGLKTPTTTLRGAKESTPRIFHQILPPNHTKYDNWIRSWDAMHFDEVRIYGDDDLENIIQSLGSTRLHKGWLAMARPIERIDFTRYAIMYLYGGVYADADQELTNSPQFQKLVDWNTIVLPLEWGGVWDNRQVGQALMISPPRERFWWDLMEYMIDQYNASCNVLINTGPLAMTNFWNQRKQQYPVRLSRLLDGLVDISQYNRSLTIHHMGGSWINKEEHVAQMKACSDRTPWTCVNCLEDSIRYS